MNGGMNCERGLCSMAFREFETTVSRRSLLRGSAYFAAAGALSGLPLGRMAMAHDVGSDWPNLATAIQKYIAGRKVPNMIAGLGWGQNPAHSVGGGKIAFGSDTDADLDSLYRIYSMTKSTRLNSSHSQISYAVFS